MEEDNVVTGRSVEGVNDFRPKRLRTIWVGDKVAKGNLEKDKNNRVRKKRNTKCQEDELIRGLFGQGLNE